MAIISIAGKIGSGKDLVGKIIQYLYYINSDIHEDRKVSYEAFNKTDMTNNLLISQNVPKIIKWADKLKDWVCIILGCTREQLEDRDFKETELGDDWKVHKVITKLNKFNDKEIKLFVDLEKAQSYAYESFKDFDDVQLYTEILTPRKLLQLIGTECGRQIIHPNIWVNATLNNYDYVQRWIDIGSKAELPNLIITDTRFPNEADAVKSRGGINIRIDRPNMLNNQNNINLEHISETSLDDYKFNYYICNDSSIENLIEQVKNILIKEKLL